MFGKPGTGKRSERNYKNDKYFTVSRTKGTKHDSPERKSRTSKDVFKRVCLTAINV